MIELDPIIGEERSPASELEIAPASVEVLVPVFNEWHHLRPCLASIEAFSSMPGLRVTILDDASDAVVRDRVDEWVVRPSSLVKRVLRNESNLGFVRNANRGFREAAGDYLVLLNSDTVVTPGWLERLIVAARSDPRIAAVMPMSNQASFHSLDMPMGWNALQYSARLQALSDPRYFDAVTVGGFCVLMRRRALDDVGHFDEAYGLGYGEESDWCMRAQQKGWRVVGAENVFVYHRGKASFGDHKENTFKTAHGNFQRFLDRWGPQYKRAIALYLAADPLARLSDGFARDVGSVAPPLLSAIMRKARHLGVSHAATEAKRYVEGPRKIRRVGSLLRQRGLVARKVDYPMPKGFESRRRPRVVYVLEKIAVSGGVLSVVQLVNRLTFLGWDAKIATSHDHRQDQRHAYTLYHAPYVFPSTRDMIADFPATDIAVATMWSTAEKVKAAVDQSADPIVPWYFVQDDEVEFFAPTDRGARDAVMHSYELIENKIVKTDWLSEILRGRGHECHKIPIGLDLDLFYSTSEPTRPRVLGFARPKTPRRGFPALVSVLREVKSARPDVEIVLFGADDLDEYGIDFEFTDLGLVPNAGLRSVFDSATVFVDTSHFQGFGRTGLEAMACGCAAVLTRFGGINEYAHDRENALLIDPADAGGSARTVLEVLDDDSLRDRLTDAARSTVQQYSLDDEARRTSIVFAQSLGIAVDQSSGAVGPKAELIPLAHEGASA